MFKNITTICFITLISLNAFADIDVTLTLIQEIEQVHTLPSHQIAEYAKKPGLNQTITDYLIPDCKGENKDPDTCKCKDGYMEQEGSDDCIKITVCDDENAESIDNQPCTCKEGYKQPEGEDKCRLICADDEEAIDGVCYKKVKTCKVGYVLEDGECVIDLDKNCSYGQVFDSDKDQCVDPVAGESASCSLTFGLKNPANLILLLSFLIPFFGRKK